MYRVNVSIQFTYDITDREYDNSYRPFSEEVEPAKVIEDVDRWSIHEDPSSFLTDNDSVVTTFDVSRRAAASVRAGDEQDRP